MAGIRQQLQPRDIGGEVIPNNDQELIERYVDRIVVKVDKIEVWWAGTVRQDGPSVRNCYSESENKSPVNILPWTTSNPKATKGIMHTPAGRSTMQPETREALLGAIAKARVWIDDLVTGRLRSLADIEGKVERHVRLLAPLAFVSPQLVSAIAAGTAPASLKVTSFAEALPCLWSQQGLDGRAD